MENKPFKLLLQGPLAKWDTVDGWNPTDQLRLVVYLIIYKVLTSQVVQNFLHHQLYPGIVDEVK